MNTAPKNTLLTAGVLWLALTACSSREEPDGPSRVGLRAPTANSNDTTRVTKLADYQAELLDLALDAASALPMDPHAKDRSRAQESVVVACLQMEEPERALQYIEQMSGWRRGAALADVAFYLAERGVTSRVQDLLDRASRIADEALRVPNAQAWRSDRVRVKIARTYALLGQDDLADRFEAGVVDSEAGKVGAARAMTVDLSRVDRGIEELEAVFASGNFDLVQNALPTCFRLFDRLYDDAERRARIEALVRTGYEKLPIPVRVEGLMALAEGALAHGDQAKALELVRVTRIVFDSVPWHAESGVPVAARLAALRHRAGDEAVAEREMQSAIARYESERESIASMFRGDALRPVAEAHVAMGQPTSALAIYRRAVEDGAENPNARPRARDLVATCCSLAVQACEPDAELRARLLQIREGLNDPW